MARSIVAVVSGYLVFSVSSVLLFGVSGIDPHAPPPSTAFALFAITYGLVFAAVGGLLAASLAPRRPFVHAAIVASIIWAIAVVSLIAQLESGSVWTELATIFVFSPGAAAAGYWRDRSVRLAAQR